MIPVAVFVINLLIILGALATLPENISNTIPWFQPLILWLLISNFCLILVAYFVSEDDTRITNLERTFSVDGKNIYIKKSDLVEKKVISPIIYVKGHPSFEERNRVSMTIQPYVIKIESISMSMYPMNFEFPLKPDLEIKIQPNLLTLIYMDSKGDLQNLVFTTVLRSEEKISEIVNQIELLKEKQMSKEKKVKEDYYCRYCGEENKSDAVYCEKCGKKLK